LNGNRWRLVIFTDGEDGWRLPRGSNTNDNASEVWRQTQCQERDVVAFVVGLALLVGGYVFYLKEE